MNNNNNNWSEIPQGVRPPVYKNSNSTENLVNNQEFVQPENITEVENHTNESLKITDNHPEEQKVTLDKGEAVSFDNNYINRQPVNNSINSNNTFNNQQYVNNPQQPYNNFNSGNFQQPIPQRQNNYYQNGNIEREGCFQQTNTPNQFETYPPNGNVTNARIMNEEEQKQNFFKRSIRKSCNLVGGSMLIFWGTTQILSFAMIIPLILTNVFTTTNSIDTVSLYLMNSILLLTALPTAGIILTKMNSYNLEDVLHLKKSEIGDTTKFIVACMGFVMVFNILLTLMNSNLSLFGFENKMSDYGKVDGVVEYILYFLSITIVPAIAEEFLFRGAVLGCLRKYGDVFAIIISSALFGIMHGNFVQTPVTFLTGLALGYLAVKTGSIIPSMILHFVNNALVVVMEIIFDLIDNEKLMAVVDLSIMGAIIIAGLICTVILIKKHKERLFTFEKPETKVSMPSQIGNAFANPCTIIFVLIMIGSGLLTSVLGTGL